MRLNKELQVESIGTTDLPSLVRAKTKALGLKRVKIEWWHTDAVPTRPVTRATYTVFVSYDA